MKKLLILLVIVLVLFFLTILSVQAQTNPEQGIEATHETDPVETWDGIVRNFGVATTPAWVYQYNRIIGNNSSGHLLRIGTEAPSSYDRHMDNSVIRGNYFEYTGETTSAIITHGLFTGHSINIEMWYNKLMNCPLGLIMKSESAPALPANSTGGMFYNYVYGGHSGVDSKNVSGIKIYNNTFYMTEPIATTGYRAAVWMHTGSPSIAITNTQIYNNVFYSTVASASTTPWSIAFELARDTAGLQCDYNVYYMTGNTNNEPKFGIAGSTVSWTTWRNTCHFDRHSIIINPQLNSSGKPGISLHYGKNLGATYQTGLAKDATWVLGQAMSTTAQSGTWQNGAFIDGVAPDPGEEVYYVATNGSDSNDGSYGHPWLTWQKGFDMAYSTKKLVYIRGGNYGVVANSGHGTQAASTTSYAAVWEDGKNGTPSVPIRVRAYQPDLDAGNRPVMNCSTMDNDANHSGIYLNNCDYWQIYGLKVTNTPQVTGRGGHVFYIINGNYNTIEFCEAAYGGGSGITLWQSCTGNIVKNFDAHHNYDNYSGGENADGIEIAYIPFNTADYNSPFKNWLIGCRSWNNSDDGYDFFNNQNILYIDSCWAWGNNYVTGNTVYPNGGGDGNGFKLGEANYPQTISTSRVYRYLYNCLAVRNENMGFSQSNCNFNMVFSNCTGISNRILGNFVFDIARADTLRNNLSYGYTQILKSTQIQISNSWSAPEISTLDLESLDTALLRAPRSSRGKLPYVKYGRPVSTSELRNAGTIVASVDDNLPERDNTYYGTKPDIGYLDYNEGIIEPPVPTLTTSFISTDAYAAQVGGNAISDGGASVLQKGVCWSSSTNLPTTSNSNTQEGAGTGAFTSTLTNLSPSTTYWARAYATNYVGTGYGVVVSFTTDPAGLIIDAVIRDSEGNMLKVGNRLIKKIP